MNQNNIVLKEKDYPVCINVKVKYEDIMIGIRLSQEHCPGALAIKRHLMAEGILFSKVLVDEERIAIYNTDDSLLCTQDTPIQLKELIDWSDHDIPASPIEFTLYLKEGFETRSVHGPAYYINKMQNELNQFGGF